VDGCSLHFRYLFLSRNLGRQLRGRWKGRRRRREDPSSHLCLSTRLVSSPKRPISHHSTTLPLSTKPPTYYGYGYHNHHHHHNNHNHTNNHNHNHNHHLAFLALPCLASPCLCLTLLFTLTLNLPPYFTLLFTDHACPRLPYQAIPGSVGRSVCDINGWIVMDGLNTFFFSLNQPPLHLFFYTIFTFFPIFTRPFPFLFPFPFRFCFYFHFYFLKLTASFAPRQPNPTSPSHPIPYPPLPSHTIPKPCHAMYAMPWPLRILLNSLHTIPRVKEVPRYLHHPCTSLHIDICRYLDTFFPSTSHSKVSNSPILNSSPVPVQSQSHTSILTHNPNPVHSLHRFPWFSLARTTNGLQFYIHTLVPRTFLMASYRPATAI
jgi:hypothetical protein